MVTPLVRGPLPASSLIASVASPRPALHLPPCAERVLGRKPHRTIRKNAHGLSYSLARDYWKQRTSRERLGWSADFATESRATNPDEPLRQRGCPRPGDRKRLGKAVRPEGRWGEGAWGRIWLCHLIAFIVAVLVAGARGGGLISFGLLGASLPVPVCEIPIVIGVRPRDLRCPFGPTPPSNSLFPLPRRLVHRHRSSCRIGGHLVWVRGKSTEDQEGGGCRLRALDPRWQRGPR